MNILKIRNVLKNPGGQSTVEFALLLCVMTFILIGMIDLVLAVHNWLVIDQAVATAARFVARGKDDVYIKEQICNIIVNGYIDSYFIEGTLGSDGISIWPAYAERTVGDTVTVTIDYKVGLVLGYAQSDVLSFTFPMRAHTVVEFDSTTLTMRYNPGPTPDPVEPPMILAGAAIPRRGEAPLAARVDVWSKKVAA